MQPQDEQIRDQVSKRLRMQPQDEQIRDQVSKRLRIQTQVEQIRGQVSKRLRGYKLKLNRSEAKLRGYNLKFEESRVDLTQYAATVTRALTYQISQFSTTLCQENFAVDRISPKRF